MWYDLKPCDSHKSFYGKAKVFEDENGNKTLYSYDTKILTVSKDGSIKKFWFDWSATTGRHIAAFCGLNKKQYESLEG